MRTDGPELRAPVMADVARLAGVSHQTVSRVVNGHHSIRPETRRRVEQAITQLGYRPNTAARALVKGRTGILGVIGAGSAHFGPTSIQHTIEDAAREAGLFASTISLSEVTREMLDQSVEHMMSQLVEAIVIVAGQDEAVELARNHPTHVPVVVVEGDLSRARWTVGVDQVAGSRMAVRHLLDLGHADVAHVAGPADWSEARARRDGWRAELVAHGRRPREPVHVPWSAAGGYEAGRRLATDPSVTAVFAASDQIALGVLRALHEAGRRVPEDVSLVGFDDIPEAGYLLPPLTTVRQDFPAVGRRGVQLAQVAMAGGAAPPPDLIAPELVVRASTTTSPAV